MNPESTYILDNPCQNTSVLAEDLMIIDNPMHERGDMLAGGSAGYPTRVASNTTATRLFLSEQGTGTAGAAPLWRTPAASEISNTPSGTISATDVQTALNELDGDIVDVAADVSAIDLTTLVPYTGATATVDLGSEDLTTTGTITASTFTGVVPYTGASSDLDLGSNTLTADKVTITGTVVNSTDAATKQYVDDSISGIVVINGTDGADGTNGADGAPGTNGVDGADGADGGPGPGVVYRGVYSESATYYNSAIRRDIVQYSGSYYLYAGTSPSTPGAWNAGDWDAFGATFDSVATDILFANLAYIDNLGVREFQGVTRGAGDLSGTVDHTTANYAGTAQVIRVTKLNDSSTMALRIDDHIHTQAWNTSAVQTVADFFTAYENHYPGYTLTYAGSVDYLDVEENVPTGFATTGSSGVSISVTTAADPAIAQVETVTLTGTEGLAHLVQNAVEYVVTFNDTLSQTASDFADETSIPNITLTHSGEDIILTASTRGVSFTAPTIHNQVNAYVGAVKIQGNDIWEDVTNADTGTIVINGRSYNGGQSHYRALYIKDGTGDPLSIIGGNATGGTYIVYVPVVIMNNLPTSNAGLLSGSLYRDGAGANVNLKIV